MGKIGFGSYRISLKSKEHQEALILALKLGCTLIDTSSNYTNGESEELIGAVLSENPQFNPLIVTKAGYIQGKNLAIIEELNANGLALQGLVEIDESLKHSIHPDFLKNQLEQSLKRLRRTSVDIFLLHNPEYYFKSVGATQDQYYEQIEKAFLYLETEVEIGRIKSYGISSNNFIFPLSHPEVTNLKKILEVAKKCHPHHHFSTIQFPLNLIEIGALEKFGEYGNESLLELAQLHNLTTMTNRPLNAFTNNQLVRLATYEFMTLDFDFEKALKDFENCMKLVEQKWLAQASLDELAAGSDSEEFNQLILIKQFREIWNNLPSVDAVEQVYFGHFFPFIARIWGEKGLSAEESAPFYELLEHSCKYSRMNMTKKAQEFQTQAVAAGLLPNESGKPFAVDVIETYLNYGVDYVLLGMKKTEYVNQVRHLF
jgi:aryl-alcohol dehydrogenase-like predicted oxidoreductase